METVSIDELENSIQPAARICRLTDALGLTDVALNYYELEPGDSFAFAYHSHELQEEVFYIQNGTATFETDDGDVEVGAGELIRFGREEFQRGWNYGDETVVALALGAPQESGTQVTLRYCQHCDQKTDNSLDSADNESAVVARCTDCGTETGRWYQGPMDGTVP
ncbi:Cupin domain-containing protein [Halovenus aranensis]|uniref:Cupin domain-containing protein n=1 Tax=Halovenus aranensis TaxID=890420 RepID=A0A1G8TWL9_9EURY|nr:cupin domain-containing protein [Halovenus aranensis]SDJ45130.1 Cupin domain-containing protein [Halovenus aranensis]